jgi:hypothetical protein
MAHRRRNSSHFVICVRNADYPASLELHKIYRAIPDADAAADGDIRVIDESGEDYLYPESYFIPIAVPLPVKRSMRKAEQSAARERRERATAPYRASLARRR